MKSIEKETTDQQQKAEDEARQRIESEAANSPKPQESPMEADAEELPPGMISATVAPPPSAESVPSSSTQVTKETNESKASSSATLSGPIAQRPDQMDSAFISLYGLLFGGQPKWPEAIGAAIAFEGDGYVVRTLIVNGADTKDNAIPFVPQFVTGPEA